MRATVCQLVPPAFSSYNNSLVISTTIINIFTPFINVLSLYKERIVTNHQRYCVRSNNTQSVVWTMPLCHHFFCFENQNISNIGVRTVGEPFWLENGCTLDVGIRIRYFENWCKTWSKSDGRKVEGRI